MPKANVTIAEIVAEAAEAAVRRLLPLIEKELSAADRPRRDGRGRSRPTRRRRRRPEEMTRWVADKNARRVPVFVIDATGLDTKKKIVARYGENASFEKGKPPPEPAPSLTRPREAARVVRPRPPIVRKASTK